MKYLTKPTVRRYLYRVGLAVIALLVGYGVITEQHALLWVALLAPLLGLADAYVPPGDGRRIKQ
ncbi:hypothetical protein [uncultured Aeromicrobium sp.]|uniref:phage holin n=1 Tax=uncultured Aeromicrobium sp. TaxID=337820 RepID=UPI0025F44309|nr:hypothetical protein [uncultured Aeromicrobium sp.]